MRSADELQAIEDMDRAVVDIDSVEMRLMIDMCDLVDKREAAKEAGKKALYRKLSRKLMKLRKQYMDDVIVVGGDDDR